jgi:hypothetical protein
VFQTSNPEPAHSSAAKEPDPSADYALISNARAESYSGSLRATSKAEDPDRAHSSSGSGSGSGEKGNGKGGVTAAKVSDTWGFHVSLCDGQDTSTKLKGQAFPLHATTDPTPSSGDSLPERDVYYVVLQFRFDEHEIHNGFMDMFDATLESSAVAWDVNYSSSSTANTSFRPTHTDISLTSSGGGSFTGSFHPSRSQLAMQQAITRYRQQQQQGGSGSQAPSRFPTASPTRSPTKSPSPVPTSPAVLDPSLFPVLTLFDTHLPLRAALFHLSIYPRVSNVQSCSPSMRFM